jgi:hypothetical protein
MARQYHQGRYTPENPQKYAGNVNEIVYRSGWELQVMIKLDRTPSVVLWNSEGLAIPYLSPVDGRMHRYFPDMLIRVKDRQGKLKTYLLEIKPHAQTQLRTPKRQTKKFLTEVATYAVNKAKWEAAQEFCKDQGWEFQVITEKDHSFL